MGIAVNKKTLKTAALISVLLFSAILGTMLVQSVKANPKTIVFPDDYPTIAAAMGNATDGDTIFVKKGLYPEKPLKIDKTLSLLGEGADSTKISFDPPYTEEVVNVFEHHRFYEDPIKVHANDFKMSDFTVETTGARAT
jgi:pectin methylesterase-like acyl-CoA thioesterase